MTEQEQRDLEHVLMKQIEPFLDAIRGASHRAGYEEGFKVGKGCGYREAREAIADKIQELTGGDISGDIPYALYDWIRKDMT